MSEAAAYKAGNELPEGIGSTGAITDESIVDFSIPLQYTASACDVCVCAGRSEKAGRSKAEPEGRGQIFIPSISEVTRAVGNSSDSGGRRGVFLQSNSGNSFT